MGAVRPAVAGRVRAWGHPDTILDGTPGTVTKLPIDGRRCPVTALGRPRTGEAGKARPPPHRRAVEAQSERARGCDTVTAQPW